MSLRFDAINKVATERSNILNVASPKITSVFGENVFTLKTAREYLSDDAYKSLVTSIKGGKKLIVQMHLLLQMVCVLGLNLKVLRTIRTGSNH